MFILWLWSELRNAPIIEFDDHPPVDPWRLQRDLMVASDQKLPEVPTLTETSLLYWALILEEQSETTVALTEVLGRAWPLHERTEDQSAFMWQLSRASAMEGVSKRARALIERMGELNIDLTREEAKACLDGTTDIAVVNSGFALACGLPGSQGYLSVLTSNLSKRNDLGKIDKTPDGKWIKGKNYVKPDLDKVLDNQLRLVLHEHGLATREAALSPMTAA